MKTTTDISEDGLPDTMRFPRANTEREAVGTAIVDFNRRGRMADLVRYADT